MEKHMGVKENEVIVSQDDSKEAEEKKSTCKCKRALKEEQRLYKKPWFWLAMVLIVFCITRPFVIIICGNNHDNTDCGSGNKCALGPFKFRKED